MKNSIYIFLSVIMGLSGCSSQKKLQTNPPFVLGEATSQKWADDEEENDFERIVKIVVRELTGQVTLQKLYYKGQVADITIETGEEQMIAVAKFEKTDFEKWDMIMHADPKKEVGNRPPRPRKKDKGAFPFELSDEEAVLSYIENDTVKYVKVSAILEKAAPN